MCYHCGTPVCLDESTTTSFFSKTCNRSCSSFRQRNRRAQDRQTDGQKEKRRKKRRKERKEDRKRRVKYVIFFFVVWHTSVSRRVNNNSHCNRSRWPNAAPWRCRSCAMCCCCSATTRGSCQALAVNNEVSCKPTP